VAIGAEHLEVARIVRRAVAQPAPVVHLEGVGRAAPLAGIAGAWKPLAECNAHELDQLAELHEARAREQHAREQLYRDLADRVRSANATTVLEVA
jgi:hypothetical protein